MIFHINFFLFSFAQSNIISYLFIYAKHYASVSNTSFGMLALVLPTLALIAKPISCSLTDAHGIHKQFLIACLATFGTSYGMLGVLAFWKDPADHENDALAWMIMCVLMCFGYTSMACVYCMNDALSSNYARKNNLSYSKMRIWTCVGWACGPLVVMLIGDIEWLPFRVPGIIALVIAILVDISFLTLWPYEEDFEMFHDGSTVEQRKMSIIGPNTAAYLAQNKPRGSISRDILERIKAGRSKSVGNLPRLHTEGLASFNTIDFEKNRNDAMKKKKPEEDKEYSNFQCQMILMKLIAGAHKSFVRYIFLFTLFGIVQGMVNAYQLDYFKARVAKDTEEFEYMSKFSMIAQSIFGEIPILFIAYDMIRIFGANANMSLALITLGMRCYFYSHLLPYLGSSWLVVSEALQGPSLGLYWILIVDIGSNYALMVPDFMPEMRRRGIVKSKAHEIELSGCLRASMIGAMSSSMEGLGIAVGSFLGGILSNSLGYHFMWDLCAIVSVTVGFINIGWDVVTKLILKKNKSKEVEQSSQKQIPTIMIENVNSKL